MNRFLIWLLFLPVYLLGGLGLAVLQSTNGILPFWQSFHLILPTWLIAMAGLWVLIVLLTEAAMWAERNRP